MDPPLNIKIKLICIALRAMKIISTSKLSGTFFVPLMEKNVCDGIGGTLKRLVARASIQNKDGAIASPISMFNWAKENIHNMNFIYIPQQEFAKEDELFLRMCPRLKPIPKTQLIHHVPPVGVGKVRTKYFSQSDTFNTHEMIE